MKAPGEVLELIERFERNRDAYLSGRYNETQLRREFLDPMFTSLGWDVNNTQGYAEAYKDVIHEDAIKVGSAVKAPDYCFRIGGTKKFFVEAKKPSVNLKDDISPAFQLRRYAWSAKLPLSILTDFEEFAVYDCRVKPVQADKASTARIFYLTYKEYVQRWDEISSIFTREAVLKGSFDKYAEKGRHKKGTAEVDDAFLEEIESWRDVLARNIALRNPGLTQRELNFAVQRTIDRIIFLRICEDRGIEHYGRLQSLLNGASVYRRLFEVFRNADERYNSGLFHFEKEKGRHESPDDLTPSLDIDDKTLKDILRRLYYPESPYEFSVLPADILGQVYEQFLGKVIRLTAGHQAKVEEKPEVRKAGGVYYTPTYIVDYIVKNTVGVLLGAGPCACPDGENSNVGADLCVCPAVESPTGKGQPRGVAPTITPKGASKLRILDPACGSGSFLLGAYQYLLDWHRDWYVNNDPKKWAAGKGVSRYAPTIYQGQGGDWRLTTTERKRILLNNIYGVDIDSQAVEVTKLSLLLKVLEGENNQTLERQLRFFHERALPDLGDNIKCGNSLIGPDFYDMELFKPSQPHFGKGGQGGILDEEERYRINVFDWNAEFPTIMKAGGFDAVIGNPPYVRSQLLGDEARRYYSRCYRSATSTYDIYVLFVEKALAILRGRGRTGFILPNKFFTTDYGEGLRRLLTEKSLIDQIVDFEDAQVFKDAGTYTNLLFLQNGRKLSPPQYARLGAVYRNEGSVGLANALSNNALSFASLELVAGGERWTIATGAAGDILTRLQGSLPALNSLQPHCFQGLKTSADKIYMVHIQSERGDLCHATNGYKETIEVEKKLLKPVVKGEHVGRYKTDLSAALHIIYPYSLSPHGRANLIPSAVMAKEYPHAWAYFNSKKQILGERDRGTWMSRPDWYAYARSQNIATFIGRKLLLPYMTTRLRAALDEDGVLFFVNITTGGYGLRFGSVAGHDLRFLLGLLNSKLLNNCIRQMTNSFRGGYFAVNKQAIERLPFRPIDFSDPTDKVHHDKMVSLVEQMLSLNKQLAGAKTDHEKTALQRQLDAIDKQIDKLVYELYGLTEEEIKIIEKAQDNT